MSGSKQSMGDLFQQRRAAAAASKQSSSGMTSLGSASGGVSGGGIGGSSGGVAASGFTGGSAGSDGGSGGMKQGKKSFAEIQREQQLQAQREREEQQQQRGGQYGRQEMQQGGMNRGGGRYQDNRGQSYQPQPQSMGREYQSQREQQQHGTDEYGRLMRPSGSGGGGNVRDRDRDNNPRDNTRGGPRNTNRSTRDNTRSSGRSSTQRSDPRSSLPLEQGIIHTLLDKFGFIYCADRPKELFFHYSEFRGVSDELKIGDEVEFLVGRAEERRGGRRGGGGNISGGGAEEEGEEKWSAFNVKKIPEGTIVWESEDEPKGTLRRGVVEKMAREENSRRGGGGRSSSSSASSGAVDGVIRLVNEDNEVETNDQGEALDIYYTALDYNKPSSSTSSSSRSDVRDIRTLSTQSSTSQHHKLERKDIVSFTLVTERRTSKKYARSITLLQSERERVRTEKEAKLLKDAKMERGVVTKVVRGGEGGFIRSVERWGEVSFHISNLIVDATNGDENGGGKNGAKTVLKEGQEVEFYVIDESQLGGGGGGAGKKGSGGNKGSLSARKIKLLPAGSVKFEEILAEGVTGIVETCPVVQGASDGFGGRDGGRGGRDGRDGRGGGGSSSGGGGQSRGEGVMGKIHLLEKVHDNTQTPKKAEAEGNSEEANAQSIIINEVALRPETYPGGTYALSRTGTEMGCWIRPGDVLLFDVVKRAVDGMCFAVPTKCLVPKKQVGSGVDGANDVVDEVVPDKTDVKAAEVADKADSKDTKAATAKPAKSIKPAIHLIEPTPATRTHGIIKSVHDNYGFVRLAERNDKGADVYFALYEVFPEEMMGDLVKSVPNVYSTGVVGEAGGDDGLIKSRGGRVTIEPGMEVALDLSLQPSPNNNSSSGNMGGRGKHNPRQSTPQETLRGRRIQLLPKGTIVDKIPLATGVKAAVSKVDARQPFAGTLEVEGEPLKVENATLSRLRHPVVAGLLDAISKGRIFGTKDDGEDAEEDGKVNGEKDETQEAEEEEEGVTFHDVLCERDVQVIISMVNGREDLEWRYVYEESGSSGSKGVVSSSSNGNNNASSLAAADATGQSSGRKLLRIVRKKKESEEGKEGLLEAAVGKESTENSNGEVTSDEKDKAVVDETAGEAQEGKAASSDGGAAKPESSQQHKKKSKKMSVKTFKSIRFDKSSFSDITSIAPLGVGDIVSCDIFLSRRSGAVVVDNINVVERKERVPLELVVIGGEDGGGKENNNSATPTILAKKQKLQVGFVSEAVAGRQFGFIAVVDEEKGCRTGEHVFFHFKEVQSATATGEAVEGGASSAGGKSLQQNKEIPRKGDEVRFEVKVGKNGKTTAFNICMLPRGTVKLTSAKPEKASSSSCTGYVLLEPSHTSLGNTPSHSVAQQAGAQAAAGGGGGRWANVRDDNKSLGGGSNVKEEGVILLLTDPAGLFAPKPGSKDGQVAKKKMATAEEGVVSNDVPVVSGDEAAPEPNGTDIAPVESDVSKEGTQPSGSGAQLTHLRYKLGSLAGRSISNGPPRRGDLVTFGKTRGAKLIKDVRVEKAAAATSLRGTLVDIDVDKGTAVFVSAADENEKYNILLTEVVSCEAGMLKDKEQVDGILHEGKIFGVCRTKDIFLSSSIGRNSSGSSTGLKERPKLNLTVKKELRGMGGQIMAQSRMAKGPDGTNGFVEGWTKRTSRYDVVEEKKKEEEENVVADATTADASAEALALSTSLSAAASEFVPTFTIAPSGFDSSGGG